MNRMPSGTSEPAIPAGGLPRGRDLLISGLLFAMALGVHFSLARVGWDNALLDTHPFRQTQTASSTYWMMQEGFRLDYATPVMGAPWSIPMEFPLYEAAVAAWCRVSGEPLDQAGRTVSLCFFYAALPALWLLLRRLGIAAAHCWLFLALVVTCPVYLFFSRAFLIESAAFCTAVWFLWAFQKGIAPRAWGAVLAAAGLGALTGIAKVTTFAVFLAPAAALALFALRAQRADWKALSARMAAAVLPGIAAAAGWVAYTDRLKQLNVFGTMMTSAGQQGWNFGSWAQRFTPEFWLQLGRMLDRAVVPAGSLLLVAVVALLFLRRGRRSLAILVPIAFAGPLAFANLFFVHDYYFYANGVLFLALLALPLRDFLEQAALSPAIRYSVVALVLGAQLAGHLRVYQPMQTAPARPPMMASALGLVTAPADVIAGFGLNWDSVLPYYSRRRAVFVPDTFLDNAPAIEQAFARLASNRVAALVTRRASEAAQRAAQPWIERLSLDPTPLAQTGEYSVYIRKDLLAAALKALATAAFKDLYLYEGKLQSLAGPEGPPAQVYWVESLADRSMIANIHPVPLRITTPFGVAPLAVLDRTVLGANATTEVEIVAPSGARHIRAQFGIDANANAKTDGVEFEIVQVHPSGLRRPLFRRWLQPGLLATDSGPQTLDLEINEPLAGTLLFRTLPGPAGNTNFDWSYWASIDVH